MDTERIILIGPMGAGKTCVGKKLAQHIGWEFFDSDTYIETKTGVDIPTIFEIEGEEGFRDRETKALEELTQIPNLVLATGGGAVIRKNNRLMLQISSFIVYLSASVNTQLKRTHRDRSRPLLRTNDRRATLQRIAKQRTPIYEELSDMTVATDNQSISDSLKNIIKELLSHDLVSDTESIPQ